MPENTRLLRAADGTCFRTPHQSDPPHLPRPRPQGRQSAGHDTKAREPKTPEPLGKTPLNPVAEEPSPREIRPPAQGLIATPGSFQAGRSLCG